MQVEVHIFLRSFYREEPPIIPESLKEDFLKFYIEINRR